MRLLRKLGQAMPESWSWCAAVRPCKGFAMRLMLLTADYPPDNWSGIGHAVQRQASDSVASVPKCMFSIPRAHERISRPRRSRPRLHNLHTRFFPIDPHGFDWIHLHSLGLAELALEIRRRTGTPLAYTAHSILALELAHVDGAARLIEAQNQLMRICDAVVFFEPLRREAALRILPELSAHSFVVGQCS